MMMFVIPAVLVAAILVPLFGIYRKPLEKRSAKRRVLTNLCSFALLFVGAFAFTATTALAEGSAATRHRRFPGYGLLAAALATGLSALGAGIAVAAAAPAAIGAFSEDPKAFGKSLIFVALGEGVAIYGLLISILILNKI